jgi:hypothetical protein
VSLRSADQAAFGPFSVTRGIHSSELVSFGYTKIHFRVVGECMSVVYYGTTPPRISISYLVLLQLLVLGPFHPLSGVFFFCLRYACARVGYSICTQEINPKKDMSSLPTLAQKRTPLRIYNPKAKSTDIPHDKTQR